MSRRSKALKKMIKAQSTNTLNKADLNTVIDLRNRVKASLSGNSLEYLEKLEVFIKSQMGKPMRSIREQESYDELKDSAVDFMANFMKEIVIGSRDE